MNKFLLLCSSCLALTFSASADDLNIKLGAHAFLDYENISVGGSNVVDGTNLRLFRVDVGGSANGYKFKSNFDIKNGDVFIRDLFVEFGDELTVRVGNFKIMNGLEQQSSLYATTFMEQSSVSKMNGLGRSLGVGLYRNFGDFHLSGAVYGPDANVVEDIDLFGASARLAWTNTFADESILHLGGSLRYRDSNDQSLFSYSQRPLGSSAPRTVRVGGTAESDLFLGVEAAYINDGFTLQGEYGVTEIDCPPTLCASDPQAEAFYVDASYVWGGHRVYRNSLFSRTSVDQSIHDGGRGAFQLSARYDMADLSDAALNGGSQDTYILGGTWYLDQYVRLMVNIAHTEYDNSPSYGNGDADSVLFRAQIELY